MPSATTIPVGVLRRCAITHDPLDVGALMAAVADPAAGGEVLFIGRVRDHDDGRPVRALRYEAHPGADDLLRAVAREAASTAGVRGVAVEHRLGDLHVGDLAVVVAVAAEHRPEAFAACRLLIDQLKMRVPIWKLQYYGDGSSSWVGCP